MSRRADDWRPPPADTVLIDAAPGEIRIAVLRGGAPWDLVVARSHRPDLAGNVYLGRVRRVEPGLAAAFVEIGAGAPGFLPLRRGMRVGEGEAVLVQVARDAAPGKVPVLTTRIRLAGRRLLYSRTDPGIAASRRIADTGERQRLQGIARRLAAAGEGLVVRRAAAGADEPRLAAELAALRADWDALAAAAAAVTAPALLRREAPPLQRFLRDSLPPEAKRLLVEGRAAHRDARAWLVAHAPDSSLEPDLWNAPEPLFETFGVEAEIERVLTPALRLPNGVRLAVVPTPALTAIDVDTGALVERGSAAASMLAANLAAAAEIARLLRFRALSGLVVVDFANLAGGAARAAVAARLAAGLADDEATVRLLPISDLGLLEMSRERLRPPLHEIVGAACAACAGSGSVRSAETAALEALRQLLRAAAAAPGPPPRLRCAPDVAAALAGPLRAAWAETAAALGGPPAVESAPALEPGRFAIETGAGGRRAADHID